MASSASREQDLSQLRSAVDGIDELLVVGGDGSVNLVTQVIALRPIRLSIIPCGTGNDFARDLGITDWRWRMHHALQVQLVSIGKAGQEYFVNHAGSGLSADLIALQPRWLKQSFGRLSYSLALCRYLFGPLSRRRPLYRLGRWYDCHIAAVSRFIGGGIAVNPQGSRQHEQLQWLAVPRTSRWRQFRALWQLLSQRQGCCAELELHRSARGELGSADAHYELDGDLRGVGPVQIECIPEGLTVVRPKAPH
ncbi:MAG: Diacylglycerol kinase [Pseudidiomarina mangrovi]|nr:MAG: Diacylglycerol kinase [Pseudidiomarina mangrovi]